jgi:hypothetical protein
VHIEPPANPAAGQAAEFAFVAIHTLHKKPTPGWAGRVKQLLVACSAVKLAMRVRRGCKAVVHGRDASCMVTHWSLGCLAPFVT